MKERRLVAACVGDEGYEMEEIAEGEGCVVVVCASWLSRTIRWTRWRSTLK